MNTTKKMNTARNPRTNSKQVQTAIRNYIIESIDCTDCDNKYKTLPEQLAYICSEFKRVAGYRNNILFHKTYQKCFIDWFQGLPSYFNISVYTHEIVHELMPSFGLPLPANKDEQDGVELFNNLIYVNFLALCKNNGINFCSYINF